MTQFVHGLPRVAFYDRASSIWKSTTGWLIELNADHPVDFRHILVCSVCGRRFPDDGMLLDCPEVHAPGLLRTEYPTPAFAPDEHAAGAFRYHRWLPVRRQLAHTGRTVVYRSERLGAALGVKDLHVAFNGYWPERGANLATGSFKELEAAAVLGRIPDGEETLVVASAGNTAAAFAELCSRFGVPVVIVVPESAVARLRSRVPYTAAVCVVAIEQAEYSDAIALANVLARQPGFYAEGGTRNVGRRDGLGTVMLTAWEELQTLPATYVQAIGSGAGAIAAHEAAERLRRSFDHDMRSPRLVLAQNAAFAPVYEAWHTGRLPWTAKDDGDRFPACRFAPELANRRPPYEVGGGLRAVLEASRGDVLAADARSASAAMATFLELEGIDIEPAAGVALAALREALRTGRVAPTGTILLNITGGGRLRYARDHNLELNRPALTVPRDVLRSVDCGAEIVERLAEHRAPIHHFPDGHSPNDGPARTTMHEEALLESGHQA
jgi:cysteate synthase